MEWCTSQMLHTVTCYHKEFVLFSEFVLRCVVLLSKRMNVTLWLTLFVAQYEEKTTHADMKLQVPDVLKGLLVDDWEAITKNMQVRRTCS